MVMGSNLLKLVLTIDFVVACCIRSPSLYEPTKDELCITWESCMWSNIIRQKPGLDFKYQGSDPDSTFYWIDHFEKFNPFPGAFVCSSQLLLLIFLLAIVILGKVLSVVRNFCHGSLQKCNFLHPSLKTVSLKTMGVLHWSCQQSCLPIISSVCILLKCFVLIKTVFKSTNNKLFILNYKVVIVSVFCRESIFIQIRILRK